MSINLYNEIGHQEHQDIDIIIATISMRPSNRNIIDADPIRTAATSPRRSPIVAGQATTTTVTTTGNPQDDCRTEGNHHHHAMNHIIRQSLSSSDDGSTDDDDHHHDDDDNDEGNDNMEMTSLLGADAGRGTALTTVDSTSRTPIISHNSKKLSNDAALNLVSSIHRTTRHRKHPSDPFYYGFYHPPPPDRKHHRSRRDRSRNNTDDENIKINSSDEMITSTVVPAGTDDDPVTTTSSHTTIMARLCWNYCCFYRNFKSTLQCMNVMAKIVLWHTVLSLVVAVIWYSYELHNHGYVKKEEVLL